MGTSDLRDQLQTALGATYTLERELGRGGMATVYLAQDRKHHRPVALKVLHPELAATLGPERFRREIELAARLQHPHILSVHDSGETAAGQLWFTMPYVEGESLRERLRRTKQLPLDDALRITREVGGALAYAHQHGVIHRDVKPENILLTTQGDALLADFGIARALAADPSSTGTLTQTGTAVGTPQYMSPEQATGERDVTAQTDVYSLGAVCYEMLTGEPPFMAATAQAVIAKMMASPAPSTRVARPAIPAAVDAAVRRALAPVPADRYATAAAFRTALETAERSAMTADVGVAAAGRRGRRVPAGVALVGLGFLIGAGVLFAWRHHESGGAPAATGGPVGLAVLPFETEGDTANAYFADGIADEIRGKLSALPSLQVIARASSNEYRRTSKSPQVIGRELGVRYLLTGTVQWARAPDGTRRVRVSPELVQVGPSRAPTSRWQQSYDTTLADVFGVQTAVATRVADRLGVVLSPPAAAQLAARPTSNLAAYDAYVHSTALDAGDPSTLRRSLVYAEQAVGLDSTFAAAWARAGVLHAALYVVATPTLADAEAARRAADRAVALAPQVADGYVARGATAMAVTRDQPAALAALDKAVRLAPSSAEALRQLGRAEHRAGRWDAALGHLRRAAALDPRSAQTAEFLSQLLFWLRRYPEVRAEAARALAIAPADLELILDLAASRLGEGDLAGARAVLQSVPPTLDRGALVAYLATYKDLYWVLDDVDRALLVTLPPAAFDNDRATWAIVRAQVAWLDGDTARARGYADTARRAFVEQLRGAPNDHLLHLFLGLALAYLQDRTAAVREGERGLALARAADDQYFIPYDRHVLARLYLVLGNRGRSLDELEAILSVPYFVSPAWLRIDPNFASLRGDPRFERLIAQPSAAG